MDKADRYYKLLAMLEGATTEGEGVAARNALTKHVKKHGVPDPRAPKAGTEEGDTPSLGDVLDRFWEEPRLFNRLLFDTKMHVALRALVVGFLITALTARMGYRACQLPILRRVGRVLYIAWSWAAHLFWWVLWIYFGWSILEWCVG